MTLIDHLYGHHQEALKLAALCQHPSVKREMASWSAPLRGCLSCVLTLVSFCRYCRRGVQIALRQIELMGHSATHFRLFGSEGLQERQQKLNLLPSCLKNSSGSSFFGFLGQREVCSVEWEHQKNYQMKVYATYSTSGLQLLDLFSPLQKWKYW